jgi:hypothetical protein
MKNTPNQIDVALAYLRKRSAVAKLQQSCPILGRDVLLYRSTVMQDEPSLLQRLLSVVKGG